MQFQVCIYHKLLQPCQPFLNHNSVRWLDTGKPDHTDVEFEIEFSVSNPLVAQAVRVVFDDVSRQQVKAFEARCKKVNTYQHSQQIA